MALETNITIAFEFHPSCRDQDVRIDTGDAQYIAAQNQDAIRATLICSRTDTTSMPTVLKLRPIQVRNLFFTHNAECQQIVGFSSDSEEASFIVRFSYHPSLGVTHQVERTKRLPYNNPSFQGSLNPRQIFSSIANSDFKVDIARIPHKDLLSLCARMRAEQLELLRESTRESRIKFYQSLSLEQLFHLFKGLKLGYIRSQQMSTQAIVYQFCIFAILLHQQLVTEAPTTDFSKIGSLATQIDTNMSSLRTAEERSCNQILRAYGSDFPAIRNTSTFFFDAAVAIETPFLASKLMPSSRIPKKVNIGIDFLDATPGTEITIRDPLDLDFTYKVIFTAGGHDIIRISQNGNRTPVAQLQFPSLTHGRLVFIDSQAPDKKKAICIPPNLSFESSRTFFIQLKKIGENTVGRLTSRNCSESGFSIDFSDAEPGTKITIRDTSDKGTYYSIAFTEGEHTITRHSTDGTSQKISRLPLSNLAPGQLVLTDSLNTHEERTIFVPNGIVGASAPSGSIQLRKLQGKIVGRLTNTSHKPPVNLDIVTEGDLEEIVVTIRDTSDKKTYYRIAFTKGEHTITRHSTDGTSQKVSRLQFPADSTGELKYVVSNDPKNEKTITPNDSPLKQLIRFVKKGEDVDASFAKTRSCLSKSLMTRVLPALNKRLSGSSHAKTMVKNLDRFLDTLPPDALTTYTQLSVYEWYRLFLFINYPDNPQQDMLNPESNKFKKFVLFLNALRDRNTVMTLVFLNDINRFLQYEMLVADSQLPPEERMAATITATCKNYLNAGFREEAQRYFNLNYNDRLQ